MLEMVFASDVNGVIGLSNDTLPWDDKEEMAWFKEITMGKTCIVGSWTYKTFGNKPLPGRKFLVITSDTEWSKHVNKKGVVKAVYFEECLDIIKNNDSKQYIVIGGSAIYGLFEPYVDRIYWSIKKEPVGETDLSKVTYKPNEKYLSKEFGEPMVIRDLTNFTVYQYDKVVSHLDTVEAVNYVKITDGVKTFVYGIDNSNQESIKRLTRVMKARKYTRDDRGTLVFKAKKSDDSVYTIVRMLMGKE
nr:MAG TPA: Dihydrofolate reductase [Caudoviricetes sp.]